MTRPFRRLDGLALCAGFATALLLAGCGGAGDKVSPTTTAAAPTKPNVRYTIRLSATVIAPQTVRVTGTTNLPDGTAVSVGASQAFRFERESEIRASHVAGGSATVENGAFATTLGPLDYGDILVGLEPGVGDSEFGPVAVIDDAVTVCGEVQTGKDFDGVQRQPNPDVRNAIGPDGEMLKDSPQAEVFGAATSTPSHWLEVVARIKIGAPKLIAELANAQGTPPTASRLAGFCL